MIHVLASIEVKPGKKAEFIELFKGNVPNVLAEDGCIEYAPAVDVADGPAFQVVEERVVTVVEKWSSLSALEAHLEAPHMLTFRERVKDLVERVTAKVLEDA